VRELRSRAILLGDARHDAPSAPENGANLEEHAEVVISNSITRFSLLFTVICKYLCSIIEIRSNRIPVTQIETLTLRRRGRRRRHDTEKARYFRLFVLVSCVKSFLKNYRANYRWKGDREKIFGKREESERRSPKRPKIRSLLFLVSRESDFEFHLNGDLSNLKFQNLIHQIMRKYPIWKIAWKIPFQVYISFELGACLFDYSEIHVLS